MTFQEASELSLSWGLVFLVVLFAAALTYAFWPANRQAFRDAAQMPFREENPE